MSDNRKVVIGIDFGATKIKVGRVADGVIEQIAAEFIPEAGAYDADSVVNVLTDCIDKVMTDNIAGIGIGIPSVVDRKNGIVYDVQNIQSWKEVHLKEILEDKYRIPVFLDNDANCFAIGEKLYGKGRSYENFIGVTLGTGIGTGIINRGTLLSDENCGSGEFGEIPYLDGKLEDYASGQFFKNKIKCGGVKFYELACNGDCDALDAYKEFGRHLGMAVKIMLYALDPGHIIFGGSIIKARELFEGAMFEEMKNFAYPNSLKNLTIEYSTLGGDAPILGAAAVYLDAIN